MSDTPRTIDPTNTVWTLYVADGWPEGVFTSAMEGIKALQDVSGVDPKDMSIRICWGEKRPCVEISAERGNWEYYLIETPMNVTLYDKEVN